MMPELNILKLSPSERETTPVVWKGLQSEDSDKRDDARGQRFDTRAEKDECDIGKSKQDSEMADCLTTKKERVGKRYACQHASCLKSFSRLADLRRHGFSHEPKQYHCDVPDCHRAFNRQDKLRNHKMRNHKKLHTAKGPQVLHNLKPIESSAMQGSAQKPLVRSENSDLLWDSFPINSMPAISPLWEFGAFATLSADFSQDSSPETSPVSTLAEDASLAPSLNLPDAQSSDFSPARGNIDSSDGEVTQCLREEGSPSTDVTPATASSPSRFWDDESTAVDTTVNTDERFLNPGGYIDNIKQLRQLVFHNSAIKYQEKANNIAADSSYEYTLLCELCSLIIKICQSLRSLQDAGFCGHFFSILVLDQLRSNVARLLPIEIARVERLRAIFEETLQRVGNRISINNETGKPRVEINYICSRKLHSACHDLLEQSQTMPKYSASSDPLCLLATTVHFLDLAVLSYVGSHTGEVDDIYRDHRDDTIHLPGYFGTLQKLDLKLLRDADHVTLQKRQLQCLDKFLGYRTVWVFQNRLTASTDERLYLSTDVTTLADIWGPLWKSKPDANSRRVERYDIGNGFIVPWERNQAIDPHPSSNGEGGTEVFCHWISTREWDDDYVAAHQKEVFSKDFFESDRLLIGASVKDRLAVNDQCTISTARKLQMKQALKNAGNLRQPGTYRPRQEKGSQSYQVQASAAGFATFGTTLEYKRVEGFNMKDALLQRWRNGSRNIQYLEIWGGVEVSLCTENARRKQLLYLLGSPGLRCYLKAISFQWISLECESAYFEALKHRQSFRKFWKEHPEWQRNIGDAINECFVALEETGVDDKDDALSALWVEVFEDEDERTADCAATESVAEEHLVVLRRSEHTWTGLLKDSPECMTMAIAESICLDFDDSDGYGMRCQSLRFSKDGRNARRYSPGYSVLQTAILVNEDLLQDSGQLCYKISSRKRKLVHCEEEKTYAERQDQNQKNKHSEDNVIYHMECFGEASQSWNGYWDVSKLREGTKLSLGSHGHLKILPRSTSGYPVLMEWQPVLNTVGKGVKIELRERALGKSGERHHSEYIKGEYPRSPLPCLLLSKGKRATTTMSSA